LLPHRDLPHVGTSQLMRQFGPCVALYELPRALTGPEAFLLVRTDKRTLRNTPVFNAIALG
jgi:hypothetical protein